MACIRNIENQTNNQLNFHFVKAMVTLCLFNSADI